MRCSRSWEAGPALHTGERTCSTTETPQATAPHEALPALERTIAERRGRRPTAARTPPSCWPTSPFIGKKVEEEAEEVARAAREETDERVASEAADVLYHLSVLMAARDLTLEDAFAEPNARRRGAACPPHGWAALDIGRRPVARARAAAGGLLDALAEQTLARERWELVAVHDPTDDTERVLREHELAKAGVLRHLLTWSPAPAPRRASATPPGAGARGDHDRVHRRRHPA